MSSICGADCSTCPSRSACKGCTETNGCPFGRQCFIASYITLGGMEAYNSFKNGLIEEINSLDIPGMEKVTELYPLVGHFINLEYHFPSGEKLKLLKDDEMYLGAQVACGFDDTGATCYGVIARAEFLLICQYGEGGTDPQLVLFKRR